MDAPTPSKIFAGNLRKRREELLWSQADVAAGCQTWGFDHVTRAAIAQIETGRRRVSLDEAVVLSYLLQTPLVDLLGTVAPRVQLGSREAPAWVLNVPTPGHDDPTLTLILARAGLPREDLEHAASRLWGHGIMEEREQRLAGGTGDVRVRRGVITRQLLSELEVERLGWRAIERAVAGRVPDDVREQAPAHLAQRKRSRPAPAASTKSRRKSS